MALSTLRGNRRDPLPSNVTLTRTTYRNRIYDPHEPVKLNNEMKFEMPKCHAPEYERWTRELTNCITYLSDINFTYVDKTKEIEELTKYWLDNYYDLNIEQDLLSPTDILFIIRCFLIVCNQDTTHLEVGEIDELSIIYNRIAILSCNHNTNALEPYPTQAIINELELTVSAFITKHYYSQKQFKKYADQFTEHFKQQMSNNQDTGDEKLFKPLTPELLQKKKALFVMNEQDPNANKGWLWSQTPNEMLCNLIPLCNRVFNEIIRTKQLKDEYKTEPMRGITSQSITRLTNWIIQQCMIEVEDDFSSNFTNLAHELQLPMGSRLHCQRKQATRDDKDMPIRILEYELGYDTVSRLGSIANTKSIDIANNPNHDNYDALVLTVFDMKLSQNKKTSLLKSYVVTPTQFTNQQTKKGIDVSLLFSTQRYQYQNRYPLITFLQRKWTIHYKQTWFTCDSVTEALLGWILIIQQEFHGHLPGNQINITNEYYKPFFD